MKCPYCNKVISSLYPKQLRNNYNEHIKSCKNKQSKKKRKKEKACLLASI